MSALRKIDFDKAEPIRLTILGQTVGAMVADRIGQQSLAQPSMNGGGNGASDGWVDGGVNLQGAAARYAADNPVGLSQDVWNGLADTQASIDALFALTMGNGAGGSLGSSLFLGRLHVERRQQDIGIGAAG